MAEPRGAAVMRDYLSTSPFALHLGIELAEVETDRAVLRMPYRPELATIGDTVHGGALATLADSAAAVAAWATDAIPDSLRGSTVGLAISYLAAARSTATVAEARVLRRGRSLVYVDVEVRSPDGDLLVKAQATYKLG